jgi:hypothetical protein
VNKHIIFSYWNTLLGNLVLNVIPKVRLIFLKWEISAVPIWGLDVHKMQDCGVWQGSCQEQSMLWQFPRPWVCCHWKFDTNPKFFLHVQVIVKWLKELIYTCKKKNEATVCPYGLHVSLIHSSNIHWIFIMLDILLNAAAFQILK